MCSVFGMDSGHVWYTHHTMPVSPFPFHSEQFSSISSLQICMIKMGFGRRSVVSHPLGVHTFITLKSICLHVEMCAWVCLRMFWQNIPQTDVYGHAKIIIIRTLASHSHCLYSFHCIQYHHETSVLVTDLNAILHSAFISIKQEMWCVEVPRRTKMEQQLNTNAYTDRFERKLNYSDGIQWRLMMQ